MNPLFQGVPEGCSTARPFLLQNCCSAWEIISGPLSMRSTIGGPPAAAKLRSSSSMRRSAVIERSTMFSSDSRVCSSTIEAILMALPSMVESNWKSSAQTTFGSIRADLRVRDAPARLRRLCTRRCRALLGPQPLHLFLLILRCSSWRSAAQARRNP